ncbi:MAG: cyclophilin-like fold protein [Anaerolineae bacterium]|jgi:hypothetical protein
MNRVIISAGDVSLLGELNDSPTAREIWDALPVEGTAKTWGEEIYFEVPVDVDQAPDARAVVEVGELGYWPVGRALCLFFGLTPASTDDRPRAYSPVNIVGRVLGDATRLRAVQDGDPVRVMRDSP